MQKVTEYLQTWAGNLRRNVSSSVSQLSLKDYIQIVIILGGYALLRPYLLKLAGKFQARDHERELDPNEMSSDAAVSARSLHGQVQVPDDTDEEEGSGTGADWGRGARRRQREMVRRILEAEEKKRVEEAEDSDKDIEEYLA